MRLNKNQAYIGTCIAQYITIDTYLSNEGLNIQVKVDGWFEITNTQSVLVVTCRGYSSLVAWYEGYKYGKK